MEWKEEFKKKFNPIYSGDMSGGYDAMPYLLEYIESLLEEQRKEIEKECYTSPLTAIAIIKKDLINQILQEMDEYDRRGSLKIVTKTDMRELLTKHLI